MRLPQHIPWRAALYFFLTGLILCVPALMNQAPLVYSDTGTYLNTSRSLLPPIDRPIGYGLIIRAVTWQSTLWTIVFFQGMAASWLIHRTIGTLFPAVRKAWRPHLIVLSLLLAISSLPWYASQIMPDALSGLLGLCVFLLVFGRGIAIGEMLLLWLMLFFFGIAHYSHLVMLLMIGATGALASFVPLAGHHVLKRRRTVLAGIIAVPVAGILFIMGYNARHGHGFVLSPTSSLFLSAKLIESGAMHTYLKRRCADRPNFLCDHVQELDRAAMHYVWDDSSPTRGGMEMLEASRRLDPVVRDLLTDPGMWPMLAWTSALATTVQFTQVDIGSGLRAYGHQSSPWWPIERHYRHELSMYMNSLQQRESWALRDLNNINMWVVLSACMALLVNWPARRSLRWWGFVSLLGAFTVMNAAATGAIANIYDRLQGRVTWLLVLAALLLLARSFPALLRLLHLNRRPA